MVSNVFRFRYLLLVIYALFNMNDVSWGTREVPKSAADLAAEAENQVLSYFLNFFSLFMNLTCVIQGKGSEQSCKYEEGRRSFGLLPGKLVPKPKL